MIRERGTESDKMRRRRVKVVDEIIETLRQDIVTRRLPHGERLPSEKELSERFGVSQPTAREAVRALETMGLIDIFHGNGSFVRSQGDYALASALQTLVQLERVGLMELLELRHVLGRYSIQLAAVKATAEDIAALELTCARFDRPTELKEVDQIISYVVDFQRAVSTAAHSSLLLVLEEFLFSLLQEIQVSSFAGRSVKYWRDRALSFQPFRQAILDGVRSRDPAVALQAVDSYFDGQLKLFEGDEYLRTLDLSHPKLIDVVSNMVQQIKG